MAQLQQMRDHVHGTNGSMPATIAANSEMLQLLVDNVKEYAIVMLGPDGTVTSWSPAAERLKGYRAEEIIGRHVSAFYTPEDVASGRLARELEIAVKEGRFEDEGWRVRKNDRLVLDLSKVESLDSYFARTVSETAKMVKLMGGETVIAGMRPSVAITATELGLTLGATRTSLTIEQAFELSHPGRKTPR